MGTPDFAVPTLSELIGQGHEIACVYTQPARPAGRGQKPKPSPVEAFARTAGLEVRTPQNPQSARGPQGFCRARSSMPRSSWLMGSFCRARILQAPRLGCFNVHASLLPRWRGAAPIQRAIMAGDQETGVSIMQMEEGLDTGPVLISERLAIGSSMTAGQLHDELARLGASLMIRALSALERGAIKPVPQPAEGVTYAKKIDKSEARIDWSKSAVELDRLIRALTPSPGAWFEAPDSKGAPVRIRVISARPVPSGGDVGEVISLAPLIVTCREGALELTHLQRAGGGALDAADFLRGFPLTKGAALALSPLESHRLVRLCQSPCCNRARR